MPLDCQTASCDGASCRQNALPWIVHKCLYLKAVRTSRGARPGAVAKLPHSGNHPLASKSAHIGWIGYNVTNSPSYSPSAGQIPCRTASTPCSPPICQLRNLTTPPAIPRKESSRLPSQWGISPTTRYLHHPSSSHKTRP